MNEEMRSRGMKTKFAAITMAMVLSGCLTKNVTMYPISGPASTTGAAGIIRVVADGVEGSSGTLTATLANGAYCRGIWSSTISAYNERTNFSATNGWNTVTGRVTSTGIAPGAYPGAGFMSCNDGTNIDIQFSTGANKTGSGIGRDNKGNQYRVII